jgi:TRAP-type mannitol/chloroaromatic compound transport system permease small subunit
MNAYWPADPVALWFVLAVLLGTLLIDTIAYIVFFFPSFTILAILGWHEAEYAFRIHETSDQTPWRPILWPFKAIIPAACILLIIQGFSELLKSLYMARTGIELEHKEKVEI